MVADIWTPISKPDFRIEVHLGRVIRTETDDLGDPYDVREIERIDLINSGNRQDYTVFAQYDGSLVYAETVRTGRSIIRALATPQRFENINISIDVVTATPT